VKPWEATLDGLEQKVATAHRHLGQAKAHVTHQRKIIEQLERDGHARAAVLAREVLGTLLHSLHLAETHLELEQAHLRRDQGKP
jgi:hypothetical protein